MSLRKALACGLVAGLVLPLSACVSVLPEQKVPEAVFRLHQAETRLPLEAIVVVREPDAPRLFGGRSMASQGPDGGLRIVPGVAWADRATRLLQIAMIDSFSAEGQGLAIDDTSGVSAAYELYWRVSDLSLSDGEARCKLQLTLLTGRMREPVTQGNFSTSVQVAGPGQPARAHALSEAAEACVAKGAEFVTAEATPLDTESAD